MAIRDQLVVRLRTFHKGGTLVLLTISCAAVVALTQWPAQAETPMQRLPAPALDVAATEAPQTVVLAGGCFWGVQGVFQHVRGVRSALSGYAGGTAASADYETVSTGETGHAESVQIVFDPKQVSYGQILRIFFSVALDPTQVGGQGPDRGSQYRSEVFFADAEQQRVAQAYIAQLDQAHAFVRPIATGVDRLERFYPAESYHQDYLTLHPRQPYIAAYDIPKVEGLKTLFPEAYLDAPVRSHTLASKS